MNTNILERQLSQLEKAISKLPSFYRFLKKCKVKYQKAKYKLFKVVGNEKDIIYNTKFFEKNLKWNIPIAYELVGILIKYFNPHSVVDVGCGNAEFLWQFQKRGIEIKGYEGSHFALEKSLVNKKYIELFDIRSLINSLQKYDLALCLEVAEHIEKPYSEILVDNLANLSDTVIFTAASPGQGGHFHINEQPKEFWINIWNKKGFRYFDELTETIKEEFKTKNILSWYYNNLMVFKRYQNV